MTEYLVRNVCTKCNNPVELTVTKIKQARKLKDGSCICNECVPKSKWQSPNKTGEENG